MIPSAFVVIDLETTDREPENAHIVEWAAVRTEPEWFGTGRRMDVHGGLVRPPVAIPVETSAVHHIIDSDVSDAPTWDEEQEKLIALLAPAGVIAVAHNAEYERTMLTKHCPQLPQLTWLCTYKAALRVWPDCPSHSNECLRYFLGYGRGRKVHQAPHSARHDAEVTTNILNDLLRKATLEDMLKWTNEPALLPRCPIGEWRGRKWEEVDHGFLNWILYKARDMREDIKFCARAELERRENESRRVAAARQATATAGADDTEGDIQF